MGLEETLLWERGTDQEAICKQNLLYMFSILCSTIIRVRESQAADNLLIF